MNIGMWLERFVIVITSLHRDFLPSSWDMYWPTFWDWATFIGTIGLFLACLFLFFVVLPMISIFEVREFVHQRIRSPWGVAMTDPMRPYGIMAEFETAEELSPAARACGRSGISRIETYTPMPVHGLAEIIGVNGRGCANRIGGRIFWLYRWLSLQYYMTVISYAHNVGGRPVHSWPAYIPVTFETTVFCAALSAVFGMLALNHLPMPYHPAFNVPAFNRATPGPVFLVHSSQRTPEFDS